MSASRLAWAAVGVFFASLWLPVGQTPFLVEHWMKVGTFAGPLLLAGYAAGKGQAGRLGRDDPSWTSVVLLVAYIIHQFEEHWVDALGRTYAFHGYVNALLRSALGMEDDGEILTRMGIFVINTSLVWLVGALAMIARPRHAFPVLAMAAIVLINAISHILAGLATAAYNPGLVTSIVVFVPASLAAYRSYLARHPSAKRLVIASLLWSLLAHIVMVGGTIAANGLRIVPETVYFAALVALSILPTLSFRGVPPSHRAKEPATAEAFRPA